jgi:uncharacterized protein
VPRQRISLTMRMDDAAATSPQPDSRAGGPRRATGVPQIQQRAAAKNPQPVNAFALAMARAKEKKVAIAAYSRRLCAPEVPI